jgi:putative nucleotidyltransferase with HDIG domain
MVALIAVGVAVTRVATSITRRLLPLSTLLGLTLVFPDQTPSRLRIAMRGTSEARLRRIVEDTHARGLPDEPAAAAKQVLELVAALNYHDHVTKGHAERVRALSCLIAEELGCRHEQLERIQWGGLLHDIGKLQIPSELLNKPGRLTPGEYDLVRTHAEKGGRLLEPLRPWLGEAVDAAYEHHECWNGQGYPRGIRGEEISFTARVVAVADVFDVITSTRSYKQAASMAEARIGIARCAGTVFDEAVVRAFLAIPTSKIRRVMGPLSVLSQLPVVNALRSTGQTALAATAAGVTATAAIVGPIGIAALPDHQIESKVDQLAPDPSTVPLGPPSSGTAVPGADAPTDTVPTVDPPTDTVPTIDPPPFIIPTIDPPPITVPTIDPPPVTIPTIDIPNIGLPWL